MEEIRIYHSFWKRLVQCTLYIAFSAALIWIFLFAADEDLLDGNVLMIVAFISACFLCLYGFLLMFNLLGEKVGHRPFMVISDRNITVKGLLKKKFISFADVELFSVRNLDSFGMKTLSIYYNPEASKIKLENLNVFLRLLRQKKTYSEAIDVSYIDMDAEKLCDLLNERLSQNPLPIAEEEPQVLKDETACTEETVLPKAKEDSIDTEVRHASKLQAICYVFLSSVIIAAVWGLIRWGWIEWGWFPRAKSYVPVWVIPGILSAVLFLLCRNFIRGIRGRIGEYAWVAILALPYFLFVNTGNLVERVTLNVLEIQAITPEIEPTLAKADYIHVAKLSTADLDTIRGHYLFDASTRSRQYSSDIVFHLYGVYPLRAIPNVYIADETTESHDYTHASEEALDEKYEHFMDKEIGFLLKREKSNRYLKRLLPSDNIEGYQDAIREIYKKENKPFDSDKIVIYEFNSDSIAEVDVNYYRDNCLTILFLEILLLIFIFAVFFNKKEYKQAVINRRKLDKSILHATPDKILVYSLPVLMAIIFLLMLLNGYSNDTTNWEMLLQWGALERVSVLENHEWWRLLTYGFLHDGFMHLLGNLFVFTVSVFMMMLTYNGYRITLVFLLSTLFSGIVILIFGTHLCVGASGGVFGVQAFWVGHELYIAYMDKDHETSPAVRFPLCMIVLNLLFSFGNGISMSGHLGGLFAGIILAVIIGAKDKSRNKKLPAS